MTECCYIMPLNKIVVIMTQSYKQGVHTVRPQSQTKLLEKVFPIMFTFLRNKTISKTTPLRKENPFPQFNVASHKRPGIRLSFEYTSTLLSGEGGEGRTSTATMFRKILSKYTIFSTVLSKIAGCTAVLRYFLIEKKYQGPSCVQ